VSLALSSPSDASPDEGYPRSKFSSWSSVAVLILIFTVASLDRHITSFMVGPLRAEFGLTDFQFSLIHGLGFAVAYAVFVIPIGVLVDRSARRRIIYIGMTVWSSATLLFGFARTFPQLFAARMVVGAGEASLNPAAYSMISDSFPKRHLTFALVVYVCGAATGNAVASTIIGTVITATQGIETIAVPLLGQLKPWRVIFIGAGLAGILLAFLIFLVPEPIRRDRMSAAKLPLSAVWRFLKSRAPFFRCHFLGFGLIHFIAYAMVAWVPSYMMRKFHWTAKDVGFMFAFEALVSVPFTMTIGWFIDRHFHKGNKDIHLLVYSIMILVCAVLTVIATTTSHPWVAATFFVLGIPMMAYSGTASAALQLVSPNEFRGQITALFLFVVIVFGQSVGPSVPAAFTDFLFKDDLKVGWSMALTITLTAPVASALLWFGRAPMRRAIDQSAEWSSK